LNNAIINVIDTGIGISEEQQKIIFEEFRQVSEGLDRQYEGTGLGLTIAKRFVELMNGKISLESDLGKGSKFTVTFPLAVPSPISKVIAVAG
ncbi:ATP-binding protein, partial [Bacteroidota bacterium]